MELKINGTVYTFKFGIGFVRELDKKYSIDQNGLKFGFGLNATLPLLLSNDVVILSDILKNANATETPKISQNELDSYLETCDNIEEVFDGVLTELRESNVSKLALKTAEENLQSAQLDQAAKA